jgi:hypothetical protein
MAIQVNGTQVIGNSRELTNIASVDATTVAALSAAGVGGGGELTFTAAEAITAGDLVSITSSGQIQQVKPGFGSEAVFSIGSPSGNPNINAAYSPTDNKFVMAWKDTNGGIYAAVGTIASNGSVTTGTAVQILGDQSGQDFGNITYVSGQNAFVIAWTNQSVGGQVRACQISGTSLSLGSSATLRSHSGGSVIVVDVGIGSSGGSSAIAQYGNFYSGSPSYARGMTLSGTSISLGNEVNLSANNYRNRKTITYDSTANKTILNYSNSSEARFRIATMSGNTITLGNTATHSGNFKCPSNGVHDPVSDKNVFIGEDGANSSYISSLVVTISGSSISLGSLTELASKGASSNGCTTDGNGTIFVLIQGNTSGPEYMFTSVTGTTLAPTSFTAPTPTSLAYFVAQPFYDDNTGYYGTVYGDSNSSGNIVARAIDAGGGISAWIGAAAESISSGASGKVTVVGGINENQSGLSIGTSYGIPPATGVLTANATPKIGMATAATKLFITTGGVTG